MAGIGTSHLYNSMLPGFTIMFLSTGKFTVFKAHKIKIQEFKIKL